MRAVSVLSSFRYKSAFTDTRTSRKKKEGRPGVVALPATMLAFAGGGEFESWIENYPKGMGRSDAGIGRLWSFARLRYSVRFDRTGRIPPDTSKSAEKPAGIVAPELSVSRSRNKSKRRQHQTLEQQNAFSSESRPKNKNVKPKIFFTASYANLKKCSEAKVTIKT